MSHSSHRHFINSSAPLRGHCLGYSGVGAAALFPAIWTGRHEMHAGLTTWNNIGRRKLWKAFEPQACGLGFSMPKLPRLNDLVRLADLAADHADRVFNRNPTNRSCHQGAHKFKRFGLFSSLLLEPARTTYSQVSAWRMGNHQVPSIAHNFQNVALYVKQAGAFTWKQVTRPSIVTKCSKSITDDAGIFTSDKYTHGLLEMDMSPAGQSVVLYYGCLDVGEAQKKDPTMHSQRNRTENAGGNAFAGDRGHYAGAQVHGGKHGSSPLERRILNRRRRRAAKRPVSRGVRRLVAFGVRVHGSTPEQQEQHASDDQRCKDQEVSEGGDLHGSLLLGGPSQRLTIGVLTQPITKGTDHEKSGTCARAITRTSDNTRRSAIRRHDHHFHVRGSADSSTRVPIERGPTTLNRPRNSRRSRPSGRTDQPKRPQPLTERRRHAMGSFGFAMSRLRLALGCLAFDKLGPDARPVVGAKVLTRYCALGGLFNLYAAFDRDRTLASCPCTQERGRDARFFGKPGLRAALQGEEICEVHSAQISGALMLCQ